MAHATKRSQAVAFLITFLPLLLSLGLLGNAARWKATAVHVQGVVTHLQVGKNSEGDPTYRATYTFQDEQGRAHSFTSSMGASRSTRVGHSATVLYLPGVPEHAAVDGIGLWFLPLTSLAFTGFWAGMGIHQIQRRRPEPDVVPEAVWIDAIVIGTEQVGERFVVLAERDRIYRSEPMDEDLGPWITGEPIEIRVDREDPEQYTVAYEAVLRRVRSET